MNQAIVQSCPSCGKKNRIRFSRLDEAARCGSCGAALPAPAEPVAVDRGTELSEPAACWSSR